MACGVHLMVLALSLSQGAGVLREGRWEGGWGGGYRIGLHTIVASSPITVTSGRLCDTMTSS